MYSRSLSPLTKNWTIQAKNDDKVYLKSGEKLTLQNKLGLNKRGKEKNKNRSIPWVWETRSGLLWRVMIVGSLRHLFYASHILWEPVRVLRREPWKAVLGESWDPTKPLFPGSPSHARSPVSGGAEKAAFIKAVTPKMYTQALLRSFCPHPERLGNGIFDSHMAS